jgi:HK97 family phage portal protein
MGFINTLLRMLGFGKPTIKSLGKVSQLLGTPYKKDWLQYQGGDYTTANISTINACCQIRAEALANAEPRLFKPRGSAVTSHAFLDSLLAGNDLMTWNEILQFSSNYLALTGATYWYMDWSGGKYPKGYYPLAGGTYMQIQMAANGSYGQYRYINNGIMQDFKAEEILPFRSINSDPKHPLIGRPLAAGADYAIQELIAMHNTRMSTFENGSTVEIMLTTEDAVPSEEAEKIIEQIERRHKGVGNANKVGLLPYGLKVEKIGTDVTELMYISAMDDVKREICEVFRVPPAMLGTVGQYNKANIDAAMAVFLTQTIRPLCKTFEDVITSKLLPQIGLAGWKFELHVEVPKNDEMIAKTLNTNLMSGLICQNEGRSRLNLPPIPSGDCFFIPVNVMRVGADGKPLDIVYTDPATGAGASTGTKDDKKAPKQPQGEAKKEVAVQSIDQSNKSQPCGSEGATNIGYAFGLDKLCKELMYYIKKNQNEPNILDKIFHGKEFVEFNKTNETDNIVDFTCNLINYAIENGKGIDYINSEVKNYFKELISGVGENEE